MKPEELDCIVTLMIYCSYSLTHIMGDDVIGTIVKVRIRRVWLGKGEEGEGEL